MAAGVIAVLAAFAIMEFALGGIPGWGDEREAAAKAAAEAVLDGNLAGAQERLIDADAGGTLDGVEDPDSRGPAVRFEDAGGFSYDVVSEQDGRAHVVVSADANMTVAAKKINREAKTISPVEVSLSVDLVDDDGWRAERVSFDSIGDASVESPEEPTEAVAAAVRQTFSFLAEDPDGYQAAQSVPVFAGHAPTLYSSSARPQGALSPEEVLTTYACPTVTSVLDLGMDSPTRARLGEMRVIPADSPPAIASPVLQTAAFSVHADVITDYFCGSGLLGKGAGTITRSNPVRIWIELVRSPLVLDGEWAIGRMLADSDVRADDGFTGPGPPEPVVDGGCQYLADCSRDEEERYFDRSTPFAVALSAPPAQMN